MTTNESPDERDPIGGEASPQTPGAGYPDSNNRDIEAKQQSSSGDSAAFDDPDLDSDKVNVLPGTGGPDDVGDIEAEPEDYNRSGH